MAKKKEEAKIHVFKPNVTHVPEPGSTHEVKSYFVEVMENGENKIVVHDNPRALYEIKDSNDCDTFLDDLRQKNPGVKFRKVSRTVIHTFGEW